MREVLIPLPLTSCSAGGWKETKLNGSRTTEIESIFSVAIHKPRNQSLSKLNNLIFMLASLLQRHERRVISNNAPYDITD